MTVVQHGTPMDVSLLARRRFLEDLKVEKLREILRQNHIPITGLKADLVNRILNTVPSTDLVRCIPDCDIILYGELLALKPQRNENALKPGDTDTTTWRSAIVSFWEGRHCTDNKGCNADSVQISPTPLNQQGNLTGERAASNVAPFFSSNDGMPLWNLNQPSINYPAVPLNDMQGISNTVIRVFFTSLYSEPSRLIELMWISAQLQLVFSRLSRSFFEDGRKLVIDRLLAVSAECKFAPNFEANEAMIEIHGGIVVHCAGIYYVNSIAEGPFRVLFFLIKDVAEAERWYIRALRWRCE